MKISPVAILLLSCCASARADGIDDRTSAALAAWKVPGAVVVVVRDGQPAIVRGYGRKSIDRDEPPTGDTLFPLASCSKAFTTALLARLADDGKLDWDDPVRRHLRGFRLDDPNADALVTLRDLVSHRTGLASHDLLWYRATWSPTEMVRRAGLLPLRYPFRSHFEYQSVMFTAAGLASGVAGGASWQQLVQERLFDPLGMKRSTCRPRAVVSADRAAGHRRKGNAIENVDWYAPEEPNAAGSVVSCGNDLVPWLRMHLNGGKLGDEVIVSSRNLAETHSPQVVIPMVGPAKELNPESVQLSYAMGWVVQDYRGRPMISHGGAIDGFRAHIAMLPREKIGIAVLTNLQDTRMNMALTNTIMDDLLGVGGRDWNVSFADVVARQEQSSEERRREREKSRDLQRPPTLPLEAYVGRYRDRAHGIAEVKLVEGTLRWEWSGFACVLAPHHGDTFEIKDGSFIGGEWAAFGTDGGGKVISLKVADILFRRE